MALDEVMKGRTTFVIAHRLATIRNATRILVFNNGRIVEAGTYDELVRRGGFFAELVQAQFGRRNARRAVRCQGRPPVETKLGSTAGQARGGQRGDGQREIRNRIKLAAPLPGFARATWATISAAAPGY